MNLHVQWGPGGPGEGRCRNLWGDGGPGEGRGMNVCRLGTWRSRVGTWIFMYSGDLEVQERVGAWKRDELGEDFWGMAGTACTCYDEQQVTDLYSNGCLCNGGGGMAGTACTCYDEQQVTDLYSNGCLCNGGGGGEWLALPVLVTMNNRWRIFIPTVVCVIGGVGGGMAGTACTCYDEQQVTDLYSNGCLCNGGGGGGGGRSV